MSFLLPIGLALAPSPGDAVLFHGGRIRLNDERGSVVEALLARDGKVLEVGDLAALEPDAAGAARVDLAGGTAVPGLQDAHGHVESYGASLENVDLVGCASFDEVVLRVAARAAIEPAGTWILGRGWDQNRWPGKAFPRHAALSKRVPAHPVFLRRVDGHAALANAAALAAAKLEGVLDPPRAIEGGRILLDEEGRATGVLVDRAMDLVERAIPAPGRAIVERRIRAAQEKLLALGLTCVHDMGTSPLALLVLKDLRARGELRLRIVAYVWGNGEPDEGLLAGLPLPPDDRDRLCVPGVKLMADGALGSRGAALLADYSDAPGERGHLLLPEADLAARIARVARLGLQPAVHAIGDRANRAVLDAFEGLSKARPAFRDLRPRVEHAQIVAPEDLARFAALGAIPSMQPTHATSDMPWAGERVGKERLAGAYAWRKLDPGLARLAFGSDFPVESPDPLLGLHAARTRQDARGEPSGGWLADQRLDGAAALAGFTSGAAYACAQEARRGRLIPGYACDLTVLSVDPVACEPAELLGARVLMTVIDGERRF